MPLGTLENILNQQQGAGSQQFNFLAHLPTAIQQSLKDKDIRNQNNLTSLLMASSVSEIWGLTQSIPGVYSHTTHEFTIFPNAVGEPVSTAMNTMSQVSSFEVNSDKDDTKKLGAFNLNPLQVTVLKHHSLDNTISELSISQIAKGETASSQITLSPLNIT